MTPVLPTISVDGEKLKKIMGILYKMNPGQN